MKKGTRKKTFKIVFKPTGSVKYNSSFYSCEKMVAFHEQYESADFEITEVV